MSTRWACLPWKRCWQRGVGLQLFGFPGRKDFIAGALGGLLLLIEDLVEA